LPERIKDKRVKREKIAERALAEMERWCAEHTVAEPRA
jgi:folate-dependent tRNA-U54 methylase TrmFO/GidA